ncbi:MAG: hypothetical protein IJB73_00440 [Firmicutes bacterium]|nr:hypothetical protein [Bacillota bacterium]
MDFKNYLRKQGELHPAMKSQDVMKMIYQAAFGAEHLLEDEEAARKYFQDEYDRVPADAGMPLVESISEDMCRVNLAAWKGRKLPAEWLYRIFVLSAKDRQNNPERFHEYLELAGEEIARGGLDFGSDEWDVFRNEYLKGGIRPVHHSKEYRQAERPAYRLAAGCFSRLMPVLEKAAAPGTGARPSVIAIDGRAASGKTTMAGQLKDILGGEIIRMDDFFLPPMLRTEERFSVPGSNVHYERFEEEVMPHLGRPEGFEYTRFDCSRMDFDGNKVSVPHTRWQIVEGSYSHHPHLGRYADITVFSTVDPAVQMERITVRNGAEMAEIFRTRWIPMEEEYFSTFAIQQQADITV